MHANCLPTASGVNYYIAQGIKGSQSFLNFVHIPKPPSRPAEAGRWTNEHAGTGEADHENGTAQRPRMQGDYLQRANGCHCNYASKHQHYVGCRHSCWVTFLEV